SRGNQLERSTLPGVWLEADPHQCESDDHCSRRYWGRKPGHDGLLIRRAGHRISWPAVVLGRHLAYLCDRSGYRQRRRYEVDLGVLHDDGRYEPDRDRVE